MEDAEAGWFCCQHCVMLVLLFFIFSLSCSLECRCDTTIQNPEQEGSILKGLECPDESKQVLVVCVSMCMCVCCMCVVCMRWYMHMSRDSCIPRSRKKTLDVLFYCSQPPLLSLEMGPLIELRTSLTASKPQ